MDRRGKSTEERFLEKVTKKPGGCWEWNAARFQRDAKTAHDDRYGAFHLNGNNVGAHRVSYELFVRPIPKGLNVLHRCDNPPCVNPEHLFTGSQLENMQDKYAKGRQGIVPIPQKLTEEDIRTIRASNLTQSKLGEAFGVHQVTISEILTRKIWHHI